MDSPIRAKRLFPSSGFLSILLLVCVSILSFIALIQSWSLRQPTMPLKEGDVAPQDLRALRDMQYVSQVKTEAARSGAERAVAPVYALPDSTVGRGQIEKLNAILLTITDIRVDQTTSPEQKNSNLAALPDYILPPATIEYLLAISSQRWDLIQRQASTVLEQVMRNPIRSEDLEIVRKNLPSLVSLTLTENEAALVVTLVSPLMAANSFYSPDLTEAARQEARAAVQPVTRAFVQGETIVSRGQIISEADFEALTAFGLVTPPSRTLDYAGAGALVGISAIFITMYFYHRQSSILRDLRSLILVSLLFLVFLTGARIILPNRAVMPYLFPIQAFGLLVSALFGMESGLVFSLIISALASYGMPEALGLMPYYILTSLCGVLALGHARRVAHFLYAAGVIALAGMAMVIAYRLPLTDTDWIGMATLGGAAVFSGIASTSIALPLQYLLAQFLGLTTALQLLEISRPDFPLLKYLLQRAPGTYQHSLQVANMAEQAAELVGADGLLTRVGALFHDVGKAADPLFFIENQPLQQVNAHDEMDPAESAETIIRHVTDGLKMVKKHRLPRRIQDLIAEHHGTLITRYPFNRALEAVGGDRSHLDETRFHYPGPAPRSKESAILMLSDGVEAQARAERPQSNEAMLALVRKVIERCRTDGQLDDVPLTLRDLQTIAESFVTTLRTTNHPRLEYPQDQPVVDNIPTSPRRPVARKKNGLLKN